MTLASDSSQTTPGADLARAKAQLDEKGYCIVENVLSRSEIAALKTRLVAQALGESERGVACR